MGYNFMRCNVKPRRNVNVTMFLSLIVLAQAFQIASQRLTNDDET